MNDEPHSHKKATVALVVVLLLAYVGSYLWMRQQNLIKIARENRFYEGQRSRPGYGERTSLNQLYWPLRKLETTMTGDDMEFYSTQGEDDDF